MVSRMTIDELKKTHVHFCVDKNNEERVFIGIRRNLTAYVAKDITLEEAKSIIKSLCSTFIIGPDLDITWDDTND